MQILSLAIQCSGRSDLILPIPILSSTPSSKRTLFVLKEGCRCRTKFSFLVLNSVVSGLRYTYAVWKTGVRGIRCILFIALQENWWLLADISVGLHPWWKPLSRIFMWWWYFVGNYLLENFRQNTEGISIRNPWWNTDDNDGILSGLLDKSLPT